MPRIPKSEAAKKQIDRQKVAERREAAIKEYQSHITTGPTKPSVQKLAQKHGIPERTLRRLLKPGTRSIDEFNETKLKIPKAQEEVLVQWCLELSSRNLPLDRDNLLEYATAVLQTTRSGEKLSSKWVDRFLTRHQDRLGRQWTHPHERIRSASATPEAISGYFAACKSIVGENGEKIPAHRQFAMDETGVLLGSDQRKRCIIDRKQLRAARNSSGRRDLITYVPIISGAGKLVENLVIFPGKKMMKNWVTKNPKKFATALSEKGYMNTVLGIEFIKFFDEATQDVAAEGPRLLQVDGHGSHISLAFLLYAKDHNIIVLGYPPHCTHLLQGLDVVIFSPLKHAYALHATEFYETTHNEVDKAEFLTILGKAVDDALTEENILLAWRKTGLRPVDPSVITPEMLAPSKVFAPDETFPVPPSSPIRGVIAAFKEMRITSTPPPTVVPLPVPSSLPSSQDIRNRTPSSQPSGHNTIDIFPSHHNPVPDALTLLNVVPVENPPPASTDSAQLLPVEVAPTMTTAANQIISTLSTTRASFLVNDNPITSADALPPVEPTAFPHDLIPKITAMTNPPSQEEWVTIKQSIIGLHERYQTVLAHNVLQDLHCKKLRQALAAKEKAKGQKKNAQQLLGTNSGRILTGDAMISALLADEEERAAKESNKEAAKALRDLRAAYNAWRTQAIADKAAKHAQNLEEWELRCEALPPGARKPKRPTQPKRKDTPARFRGVSRRKKPAERHVVGDSDEWDSDEGAEEVE